MPQFEKGNDLGPGRPKGSINKLTAESREVLAAAIRGELDKIAEKLGKIEDPTKWAEAVSKFLPYYMPRLTSGEHQVEVDIESRRAFDYTRLSQPALTELLNLIDQDEKDMEGE